MKLINCDDQYLSIIFLIIWILIIGHIWFWFFIFKDKVSTIFYLK